jgi:dipeptidyl aminopeptidase/acylaminoacyl peptidase
MFCPLVLLTVPFLLLHGEEDAQVPRADADKLFAAIAAKDKTTRAFTAAEGGAQHCQRDYLTLACDTVADWLEDRFNK